MVRLLPQLVATLIGLTAATAGCSIVPMDVRIDDSAPPKDPAVTGEQRFVLVADWTAGVVRSPGLSESPLLDLAELSVGSDGGPTRWRCYFHFDLSAIPRQMELEAVVLTLDVGTVSSGHEPMGRWQIWRLPGDVEPGGLTWVDQPAAGPKALRESIVMRGDRTVTFDLSEAIGTSRRRGATGVTLRLQAADEALDFSKSIRTDLAGGPVSGPRLEIIARPAATEGQREAISAM